MVSVAIVNVTSYTGLELLRLLSQHPQFVVTSVTARSAAGKRLTDIFPQVRAVLPTSEQLTPAFDPSLLLSEEPERTDLAFVCLPHAAAAETVARLLNHGTKVVDLSADFRLRDVDTYEQWYKHTHPVPALLETAVYGLCELHRERIRSASLIANPGCYATASILALAPACAAGIIEPGAIIDAKSGVSGSGRSLTLSTHYAEVNEDSSAYKVTGHQHLPEITQELEAESLHGEKLRLTFMSHLLPMTRGILATCYADLRADQRALTTNDVRALYERYYADEPFVHVVDQSPHTKWSYGSNHCFIHPVVDARTQRLVIFSCLDNLVKGAAGQAVQNANLLYALPETAGLTALGVNP
ncbi:MAG: N-acetyl-gamma-glutamyl-phosphate reductase [Chloroflexota bacterium]|nr:N-acetyl-gamma-glutamyl-phosphate reductase [Chloroflexota bacterium]